VTQSQWDAALRQFLTLDAQHFLQAVNDEYLFWDKVKHRPLPESLDAGASWALVKLSRLTQRFEVPLKDTKGRRFSYGLPPGALSILHEVDRWSGNTLALAEGSQANLAGMQERVIINSLMEEAVATAQIEGAATTRKIAKQMLITGRQPRDRSEKMILNSYRAIQLIKSRLTQPLSLSLLFEIQETLTAGTLDDVSAAGRLRFESEDINIVDTSDGEIIFTPPPASDLPRRLQDLFDFVNTDHDAPFIHPVVKAAILHFWLAYEHPFVDGNGRTARAIFYWYMLKQGYWLFEFLTVSRVILDAPMQYYKAFIYTEIDDNDLTYSIIHMLRATHQAISALREWLARKQTEHRTIAVALRHLTEFNHRQRLLIDHALRHPDAIYTFQGHQGRHNVTLVTARKDLEGLAAAGVLTPIKYGRQKGFMPHEKLEQRLSKKKAVAGKRAPKRRPQR